MSSVFLLISFVCKPDVFLTFRRKWVSKKGLSNRVFGIISFAFYTSCRLIGITHLWPNRRRVRWAMVGSHVFYISKAIAGWPSRLPPLGFPIFYFNFKYVRIQKRARVLRYTHKLKLTACSCGTIRGAVLLRRTMFCVMRYSHIYYLSCPPCYFHNRPGNACSRRIVLFVR